MGSKLPISMCLILLVLGAAASLHADVSIAVYDPLAPVEIPFAVSGSAPRQTLAQPDHGALSASATHWIYRPGEGFTSAGDDHFVVEYFDATLGWQTRIVHLFLVPSSQLSLRVEDFESGAGSWTWPIGPSLVSLQADGSGNHYLLAEVQGSTQSFIEQPAPEVCALGTASCILHDGTTVIENCGTVDPDPGSPDSPPPGHSRTGSVIIYETTSALDGAPSTRVRMRVTNGDIGLRAEIREPAGSWRGTRWMSIPDVPTEFRLRLGASHELSDNTLRFAVGEPGGWPTDVAVLRDLDWVDHGEYRWGLRGATGLYGAGVEVDNFVEAYGFQSRSEARTLVDGFDSGIGQDWDDDQAGDLGTTAGLHGAGGLAVSVRDAFTQPITTVLDLHPMIPSRRLDASFYLNAETAGFPAVGHALELLSAATDAAFAERIVGLNLTQTAAGLALQAWLLDEPGTVQYSPSTVLDPGDHRIDLSWASDDDGETLRVWLDGVAVATVTGLADGHRSGHVRFGAWNPGMPPTGFLMPGTIYLDSFSAVYGDGNHHPR